MSCMNTPTCILRHELPPLWQTLPRAYRVFSTTSLRATSEDSTTSFPRRVRPQDPESRNAAADDEEQPRVQDGPRIRRQGVLGTRGIPNPKPWRRLEFPREDGARATPYRQGEWDRADMPERTLRPATAARYKSLKKDDGTMTAQEKEAFQALFRHLGRTVKEPGTTDGDISPEALAQAKEDARLAEDLQELDPDDNISDEVLMEDEDLQTTSQKVEAYPKALRDLARRNLQQDEKRMAKRKVKKDPLVGQINSLLVPIRRRMLDAGTDVAVWQIVEEELFAKVRELRLDEPGPGPKDKIAKETTAPRQEGENKMSLQIFAGLYQRLLFVVAKILCRRTTYTPLAFALLPAMKSQGPSSYAMGVSSGLFNELLYHHWRVNNTIPPLLSLLMEMDRTTSPMTTKTLEILDEVTRYRSRAEKGLYGEAVRHLEMMPDRRRDGNELRKWKLRISDRLQEAELEKVRRREREKALRAEGALGDDGDLTFSFEDEATPSLT